MTAHHKNMIRAIPSGQRKRHAGEVFQLKITLKDSTPKVWRRILVPAEYTFFALHCTIQDAMGWTDSHLHSFCFGDRKRMERIVIESPNPDGDLFDSGPTRDERTEVLSDSFGKIPEQCVYCYDFGDNWDHTVVLERALPREVKSIYPQCVAGANACPPEDCGGVWGYANVQEILKNPCHKEHADMLRWLGLSDPKDFRPYDFDPAAVNFIDPRKRLVAWNKGFGI